MPKDILKELYEKKPFFVPNGGDIQKVEVTYKDWLWIENFILSSQKSTLLYVIDEVKKMKKTKTFPQHLNKFDGTVEHFERLSDGDIHYNHALSDIISKLQSLIDNK